MGLRQRLIKVVLFSTACPALGRRVAIRSASERSVLSEKCQRAGSWEVTTVSRTKNCSITDRVCCQDGPVHTVSGSTRARRPSFGRILGTAAATKADPSPAVADALLTGPRLFALRRRESSFWSFRRSVQGKLPKSRFPPTERVKGGFIIAKSRVGREAVSPSSTPLSPRPVNLSGPRPSGVAGLPEREY